jgi:hypothetical protein
MTLAMDISSMGFGSNSVSAMCHPDSGVRFLSSIFWFIPVVLDHLNVIEVNRSKCWKHPATTHLP